MKNTADAVFFTSYIYIALAICAGASQISPDGRTEIAYVNFCSPHRKKTLRNGD